MRGRTFSAASIMVIAFLVLILALVTAGARASPDPLQPAAGPMGVAPTPTPKREPEPEEVSPKPPPPVPNLTDLPHPLVQGLAAPGDVIENFPNTWASSTIGLVYNPAGGFVRYAHESDPNPTIYDVDYPVPHPVLGSITLSAVNPGWPATLNNRNGAGYDYTLNHYFLPDYNGDLTNADDNIVEISPSGTILNAWETDGAGNDSYDGTAIDRIIDIAVVPGSPTRYFVAAAGDGSLVYEIELAKAGWWVPDSWGTLNTCPVPGLGDNVGIDYDERNGVLYHSDLGSNLIVVTDLNCNLLTQFSCPSPAGFNTGVTFIEDAWPPEVWVTDYTSNSTTRCEAVGLGCTWVELINEEFESWPPSDWTIINNGGDCVWESSATTGRPNNTGGPGYCADADSDWCGNGTTMDTELWTPVLDLSRAASARVVFQTEYQNYSGQDFAYVDISTDGGGSWTNLLTWNEDHAGPMRLQLYLTPYVGYPNTVIRWHYWAPTWDWWWEVDSVVISACERKVYLPLILKNYGP